MFGPLALFRCDGGPAIGGGHVARCLALADELHARGWRCAFAVSPETRATLPSLAASGHAITEVSADLPPEAEAAHLAKAVPEGCLLLIVDHYGRDARFERACRPWARHILAIDDLADRPHDADWLLDPTLGRQPSDYSALLPPRARFLLGPRYAPLRPEFAAARSAALDRRRRDPALRRLLISFGSTDPLDATGACLDALAGRRTELALDVVLGAAAPHLESVRRRVAALPNARLHIETKAMAALMEAADCALGGAGATSWERCCLGLPAMVAELADNQRGIALALSQAGAVASVGAWGARAANRMIELLGTLGADDLARLSSRAADICDGSGIFTTANTIEPLRRGVV